MKIDIFRYSTLDLLLICTVFYYAVANHNCYIFRFKALELVKSTKPKAALINDSGFSKTYAINFTAGDEIVSGLMDFAVRNQITSAHFTGLGDSQCASFGWYDQSKGMFKVNMLDNYSEITSLIGDISINNNTPVIDAHIALAADDGIVHGGHLLNAYVGHAVEVMLTLNRSDLHHKSGLEY
jgi:uncharacterized protein